MKLLRRFCDETTLHGFRDLYNSHSKYFKIFWSSVIIISGTIMFYQFYQVINNFRSNPTKTQITILPTNIPVDYPPIWISPYHFANFINVSKIFEYNFDANTFLYTMSYFNRIYTPISFNVTEANVKLKTIMKEHNFSNLYHLGIKLSLEHPQAILTDVEVVRYFLSLKQLIYFYRVNSSSREITFETRSFKNYELTEFNRLFMKHFNRSLINEYKFYNYFRARYFKAHTNNLLANDPFSFNPTGGEDHFHYIDPVRANYDYHMKATYYKWMPSAEKKCQQKTEIPFYSQCLLSCVRRFPFEMQKNCKLYFLPTNVTLQDIKDNHNVLKNVCDFDESLIVHPRIDKNNTEEGVYQNCIKECLLTCDQWRYEFSQILSPKQIEDDGNNEVIGEVTLFYQKREDILSVALVPSATWDDVLASIGGLLGLWLGGSIISFIQLIYFFCLLPTITWVKSKRKGPKKCICVDTFASQVPPVSTTFCFNPIANGKIPEWKKELPKSDLITCYTV